MTEPKPRKRASRKSAVPPPVAPAFSGGVLSRLLDLAVGMVSTLDPEEVRLTLLTQLTEILPFIHGGILWLLDRATGRLRVSATHGLPLLPRTLNDLTQLQIRSGEGMAGAVMQRGEPAIIYLQSSYHDSGEYLTEANQSLVQQLASELPPRLTVAAVPLRVANEIIGVLELLEICPDDDHTPRLLTDSDLPLLQTFANVAAAALRNAQIHSQAGAYQQRLKAFDAVVTAISTATDLTDLMRSVLDVVVGLMHGSSGALLLLDREQELLMLGAQQGLPPPCVSYLQRLPLVASPCEEVVHFGQPAFRPLFAERGEGVFLEAGLQSAAYLPLLAGGTVAGVLMLFGSNTLQRSVDLATMMPICNQVGFAIANVRLYEDSLRERRKLHTVVYSIAEGVVLCDSRGRMTLYNEAAQALFGRNSLPYEQAISEMAEFYGFRDLDGIALPSDGLPMARALAGELFHDYRLVVRGASGDETVMSFSGAPALGSDGTIEGAVVVFRDITALQRVERAKDEFLAVAAHELRSPLAAVRSYADLLLRREQQRSSEADSRDLHGLTILTQQVQHMLRLVDNLLDVSRLDAGQLDLQLQRINLVALVYQVMDQQRPAAASRELTVVTPSEDIWVECDSLRIRQVITNLVSNAIKYGPSDSVVTVRISAAEAQESEGESSGRREVQVAVQDEGGGITPEQQSRLFQRFYRAPLRRAEGLGLGLYLSRQFVLLHGGRIWVESHESIGTTFYFTLPLDD